MQHLHDQDAAELISITGLAARHGGALLAYQQGLQSPKAPTFTAPTGDAHHVRASDSVGWTQKKVLANPQVAALREGLKKIKPLIDSHGNDVIPQKTVDEINGICSVLVKSIAP